MKNDEIVVGKWYVINESKDHARERERQTSSRYYYRWSSWNFDPVRWGKCIGDAKKGHKKFEVLQNKNDTEAYLTKEEEHTCRSVIEELEKSPIPVEGTDEYQEWKDRLFKTATEEFEREQYEQRVQQVAELVTAAVPDMSCHVGYRNQLTFSENITWLLDLIETTLFSMETMNLNEVQL